MGKHTIQELQTRQALPLKLKIALTKSRIRDWVDWYGESGVYVSFSGGKDSTVLLDLVRQEYPNVTAVFVDTGLEYPEVRQFVKSFDSVEWLKPKKTFKQVIAEYGYPLISKEVTECVYGAKKYLTKVLEEANAFDRQTDRQTDACLMHTGMKNYVDTESMQNKWTNQIKSFRLEIALMQDQTKAIDNLRVQRMMGINKITGKAKSMEDIPSEKDRSMFACTKWQFLLDAPFEISNHCCNIMKKAPASAYHRKTGKVAMTAQMASESRLRTQVWLKHGCNAFDAKKPISNPMSFWTEQDVLHYIYKNKLPIASVYGDVVIDNSKTDQLDGQMTFQDVDGWDNAGLFDDVPVFKTTGCDRTGCMFCGFGAHLEKPGDGRFERLKVTHPKQYEYIMRPWEDGGLGFKQVIDWINENGGLDIRY